MHHRRLVYKLRTRAGLLASEAGVEEEERHPNDQQGS